MNRPELTRSIYIVLIAAILVIGSAVLLAFVLPEPEWATDPINPPATFGELLLGVGAVGVVGAVGAILIMAIGTRLIRYLGERQRRSAAFRRLGGPSWSERMASQAPTGAIIAGSERGFSLWPRFRRSGRPSNAIGSEPIGEERRRGSRIFLVVVACAIAIVFAAISVGGSATGGAPSPTPALSPVPTPTTTPSATPSPSATPTPSVTPEPSATPTPSATPMPSATPAPTPKPTPKPTPTPTPKVTSYTVKAGDTIYSIACKLPIGCSGWDEIAAANYITGPDYALSVGDVLTIP